MVLYKSIVLISILCYFGVVKSVYVIERQIQSNTLEEEYVKKIIYEKKNTYSRYNICSQQPTKEHKLIVMTACRNVISEMWNSFPQFRRNLYVYYSHYRNIKRSLCEPYKVELFKAYPKFNILENVVEQMMIPCFGRPLLIYANSNLIALRDFFKIFIYPSDNTLESWLVFEYNLDTESFALIKWYDMAEVMLNILPAELLIYPPPMKIRHKSEIYASLFPFISTWNHLVMSDNHVLHRILPSQLRNLCLMITGKYRRNEINIHNPTSNLPYFSLILKSPLDDVITLLSSPGYSCNEFIASPGWFLFAGPGDNLILLGKKSSHRIIINNRIETVYKIKQYIKNIYKESLDYIF